MSVLGSGGMGGCAQLPAIYYCSFTQVEGADGFGAQSDWHVLPVPHRIPMSNPSIPNSILMGLPKKAPRGRTGREKRASFHLGGISDVMNFQKSQV